MANAIRYIVFGNVGSDAGYWVFRDGHWEHVGGWEIDALREVQAALAVLRESAQLKTPGLAESVANVVHKFVGEELGAHIGGESNTVIIA